MEAFLKFLIIIFNIFGLSNLKLNNGQVEISRFWRFINFLRIFLLLVPMVWIIVRDDLYYQVYIIPSENELNPKNGYAILLIFRFYYILEGISVILLSVYCVIVKPNEILNFLKLFEKIEIDEDLRLKLRQKVKKVLCIGFTTILMSISFMGYYWKWNSIFSIIAGFLMDSSTFIFLIFTMFVLIFGHYVVILIEQHLRRDDQICISISLIIELINEFVRIFSNQITMTFLQVSSFHVLKVNILFLLEIN